jgi:hypothetical protein
MTTKKPSKVAFTGSPQWQCNGLRASKQHFTQQEARHLFISVDLFTIVPFSGA